MPSPTRKSVSRFRSVSIVQSSMRVLAGEESARRCVILPGRGPDAEGWGPKDDRRGAESPPSGPRAGRSAGRRRILPGSPSPFSRSRRSRRLPPCRRPFTLIPPSLISQSHTGHFFVFMRLSVYGIRMRGRRDPRGRFPRRHRRQAADLASRFLLISRSYGRRSRRGRRACGRTRGGRRRRSGCGWKSRVRGPAR